MAERRMFAKTITDSDAFLDMPLSTQALYFHLSMKADDDGFVNSAKRVQRAIGAADDDLKLLIAKNFIIPFKSGVIVIKHWKINNYIQNDRYKETAYIEEKQQLAVKENRAYTLLDTECIHDGYSLDTQIRIDKNSIDKQSNKLDCSSHLAVEQSAKKYQNIVDEWNTLTDVGIKPIKGITDDTQRSDWLRKRIRQYGEDAIIDAIREIRSSSFLQGKNKKGWCITFDWFIRPNNFPKVLEGNYRDRAITQPHSEQASFMDDLQ